MVRLFTLLISIFLGVEIWALSSFTYQGRLFDSSGSEITVGTVPLKIQILDPSGSCLLYEESHDLQMADSAGFFSVSVGLGTKNSTTAPSLTFSEILSNRAILADAQMGCPGDQYIPNTTDHRLLRVFVDGTRLDPDQVVSSLPRALYANEADSLQGKSLAQVEAYSDINFAGTALPDLSSIGLGQSIRWGAGGWELFTPGTSTVTAGVGLEVSGSDFQVKAGTNISVNASGVHVDTTNLDADQLDGQEGSYYRDFGNLTNVPTGLADGDDDTTYTNATTAVPGLMSDTDKLKLDGMEAGATGDQSASEILTAVKTVDGSTSGLDADLFDGLNSSAFVQTESDPSVLASVKDGVSWSEVSGKPSFADGHSLDASDGSPLDALVVAADGNVGIGTNNPSGALEVSSTIGALIPPRMTTTQRDALSSPPDGSVIYNITTGKLNVRESGAWTEFSSGGGFANCSGGKVHGQIWYEAGSSCCAFGNKTTKKQCINGGINTIWSNETYENIYNCNEGCG